MEKRGLQLIFKEMLNKGHIFLYDLLVSEIGCLGSPAAAQTKTT
jgi:hypothetical protein